MWTSASLATSASNAAFETGLATSLPVRFLIASFNLSIKLSTSEASASFPVSLFATASALVNAVSNGVFVSDVALVYLSVFFTSLAFATNCCRESILASKPWAFVTTSSTSSLSVASLTCSIKSAFCALFKWGRFVIVSIALLRVAFASASLIILSNWFFDVAASICFLYSVLSASDNPGIWSIFFLYSSFKLLASSWAFALSFNAFCFLASSTIFSTSVVELAKSIRLL